MTFASRFESLKAITRRALWIHYKSPLVCQLPVIISASGISDVSVLDILPTRRAKGPVLSVSKPASNQIRLDWVDVPEDYYAAVIYRANTLAGPFSIIASGVLGFSYVDTPSTPGLYFYFVTAIEPDFGESEPSNTVFETAI